MSPSLATLLAPLEERVFRRDHWQTAHAVVRGALDRFGAAVAELGRRTVQELALAARGDVQVWFTDREARYRSIAVPAQAALALYDAGMTLYFDCDEGAAREWAAEIGAALGRKPGTAVASLFASRAGERVGTHFDRNENFTVQLRGRKRWHVGSRPRVVAPAGNWVAGMPVPHWLRGAAPDGLPGSAGSAVEGATAIELSPGTMLYVPAGFWHATETIEDSLSLNLNLTGEGTWAEVAQSLVGGLLEGDPAARVYASGAWTARERTLAVHAELDAALDRLRARLGEARARDLWGPASDEAQAPLDEAARLRRNPLGALFVESSDSDGQHVVVTRHGAADALRIDLPHALAALGRWLREREGAFTVAEALESVPFAAPDDARELLAALVAFGYLSPAAARGAAH